MVSYVDIHAHLDFFDAKEIETLVNNAKANKISHIVASGMNYKTNRFALEVSKKYDMIKPAIGLYPIDSDDTLSVEEYENAINSDFVAEELKFIEKNKNEIIAISEIGMDYKYCKDKELQKKIFTDQLELAEKLKKPVVIHSRKAEEEVIDILETTKLKNIVMHCFCGKKKFLKRGADNRYFFSVPVNVVKSTQFQMLVEEVRIGQLLTETDAPFLGLDKEIKNEPANVIHTVKKIAEIKKMDNEETANNIFYNFQRTFL